MTEALNPFPDYPVSSLDDDASETIGRTVVTPAVSRALDVVRAFAEMWSGTDGSHPSEWRPFIVAVRGDYGAGKTHLLLFVQSMISDAAERLKRISSQGISILTPCTETDPVEWYRTTLANRVEFSHVEDAVLRMYANAGIGIAKQVRLTKSAVERLRLEPRAVHQLVKDNLLNASAVEQEFRNFLNSACESASPEILSALTSLLWAETAEAAKRWLRGETLSADLRAKIGVASDLSSDTAVAQLLVAWAGLFSQIGQPFVLMIDELEHFTRHDAATGAKKNITWLKRLLENLSDYPVLVIVSGHWSAWEATSDYLDRFSPDSTIDIHSMSRNDVEKILNARVPGFDSNGKLAAAIVKEARGNIRRILTLCHVLFSESEGFSLRVTPRKVKETAHRISRRISPRDALFKIHDTLESQGFSVQKEALVAEGVKFDLAAYRGNSPQIVVQLKHSVNQATLARHLKRFLEQLQEVRSKHPDLIGYFVSDGAADPKLRSIIESEEGTLIHFFDISTPTGLVELREKVRLFAKSDGESNQEKKRLRLLLSESEALKERIRTAQEAQNESVIEKLERQREQLDEEMAVIRSELEGRNRELQAQIKQLEEHRSEELRRLQNRLMQLSEQVSARERDLVAPQDGEAGPPVLFVYEDLRRAMPFSKKFRLAVGSGRAALILLSFLLFFVQILVIDNVVDWFAPNPSEALLVKIVLPSALALIFIIAILAVVRSWFKIEDFLDFRGRVLRETYIRSERVEDLLRVDQLLEETLLHGSPGSARLVAENKLKKLFPPQIFDPQD